ncbi:MAG: methyl-accepting chemotaxis protein [Polyangiales bacterium]
MRRRVVAAKAAVAPAPEPEVAPPVLDLSALAGAPENTVAPRAEVPDELARQRRALRAIAEVCTRAAGGDLEARVEDLGDDPDTAAIRDAVNQLLDLTDAFVREASAALEHASQGQFYRRVLTHGLVGTVGRSAATSHASTASMQRAAEALRSARAERAVLAGDFEEAVQSVTERVARSAHALRGTSGGLTGTTDRATAQSRRVADAAAHATANVTNIAGATEDLLRSACEIEAQVSASVRSAREASSTAERATATVNGLDQASQRIGKVVTVITDVANQTRLLALNAAIEAARAGATGRGFAVVASEVKNLATQTAEATETIGAQVEEIQQVARAASAIRTIGEQVQSLEQSSDHIGAAVGSQRAAAHGISQSIQETVRAAREVSEGAQDVTHATQESSAAAAQMERASSDLLRLGEQLRERVERFLDEIRG